MKHFSFFDVCGRGIDSLFLLVHILLERTFVLAKLGLYVMLLTVGQSMV